MISKSTRWWTAAGVLILALAAGCPAAKTEPMPSFPAGNQGPSKPVGGGPNAPTAPFK